MDKPKCRLCGVKHLLNEAHVFKNTHEVFHKAIKAMAPDPLPSTVKHCPTCTCKRVYKTAAERQKAYRERRKTK